MARMTKEELREDPILEHIQSFLGFVERNSRWIGLGVVILVVVLAGSIMVQRSKQRAEAEAEQLLAEGQTYFLQGNYVSAESQLQELLDSYGGTHAALAGRIYLGDALLAEGRASEALRLYEEAAAKADEPFLRAAGQRGRGA